MREDGYAVDAEGFNLQSLGQALGAALPGLLQGATTGTSVAPGWGTLIGALGGAATSMASQGGAPARPATGPVVAPRRLPHQPLTPAPPPGGGLDQVLVTLLANPHVQQLVRAVLGQAPLAAPTPVALSPVTPPAPPAPQAPPQVTPTPPVARKPEAGAPVLKPVSPGQPEAEAEAEGGAVQWLLSQRVARLA